MNWFLVSAMILVLPVASAAQEYNETGTCSYYGGKFNGRRTSSGETYDKTLYTAAHRTLPFNTLVCVTNLKNNKQVTVRVNDRGPNVKNRLIDVSYAAAKELDMLADGVVKVTVKYAGMAKPDSVKAFLDQHKKEIAIKNAGLEKQETPVKKELNNITPNPQPADALVPDAFYDHDMKPCEPKGYGVQLGYFKNMSYCRNMMHDYEARYSTLAFIQVVKNKNGIYYKLIIGQFAGKQSATRFRDEVKKENPSCFIVSYSLMSGKK